MKLKTSVAKRGITRICHFTPSRTLFKITQGRVGILSASHVQEHNQDIYNPTDVLRLDGHPNHVCCSIQFPNTYYLKKAQDKDPVFKDWVVLMINPRYLWASDTKFCPVNAAKGRGHYITDGLAGFDGLFSPKVHPSDYPRAALHRPDCPTDMQAEVLVPDRIDLHDIIGVATTSEAVARLELDRLRIGGVTAAPPFYICPDFFDVIALRNIVRNGRLTVETKLV